MKKKVLFSIRDFNHGGINKSLESLLYLFDNNRYDISIFCAFQDGPYKKNFLKYSILKQDKILWYFCVNYKTLKGWKLYIALLIKFITKILLKIKIDIFSFYLKHLGHRFSKKYHFDVVIAYAEGWITYFVSNIDSPIRIAWIHMDYKRVLSYEKYRLNLEMYSKFNNIITPCHYSVNSFKDIYPCLSERVVAIKNILNIEMIKHLSDKPIKDFLFKNEEFTIVSIGRICYEKQFFEIPQIASNLHKKGVIFKWYIIGGGSEVETNYLKAKISEYKIENSVILLGAKDNPYPYIKQCDLVAITSISETFSYVAYEAKVLGIPIISTDFGAANEIVENNTGIISSLDDYSHNIQMLINDTQFYKSLKQLLKSYQYDNYKIMKQIYNILG